MYSSGRETYCFIFTRANIDQKCTMMWHKGELSLTVWMVAMVIFAPSASACLWCNSDQWLNFQNCLYSLIRNEPSFGQISVEALDDMRNSITAASQAITQGNSPMKMKMLVGAMAGEMSELIKPISTTGDNGNVKAILMSLVQVCSMEVSGQSDLGFVSELSRTLDFMMDEPSYDNPRIAPDSNDAPPKNADQSFRNPVSFDGQNNYGSPPGFNNVRQPQTQPQSLTAETVPYNAAAYQRNNQQAPNGITFPNNQIARYHFSAQTAPSQRNINAASSSYPFQPQIVNANRANGFNTFNQNPSLNPSVSNANAASNSYSQAQNSGFQQQINNANFETRLNDLYPSVQAKNINMNPASTPYPLNSGSFIQPQITRVNAASSANSYNSAGANTDQNIPQNNIQNQFPPGDPINNQVPSYPKNNLQNQQFPAQSSINQQQSFFRGSGTKAFEKNYQNIPQNYRQNQLIQYPVSNRNGLGQSGTYPINNIQNSDGTSPFKKLPSNNNYSFPNQDYPNNPLANTPYDPSSGPSVSANSNSQSFITQDRGNFPNNYPDSTNKAPTNRKNFQNKTSDSKQQQNKTNGVTNKKNPKDDDTARAMRFVETIYVILSQSNDFKIVFNEQIPNDQALSLMYTIDVGALNDCGFSRFSVEIANACAVVIESLPDGCSSVQYAEALSKVLMDQLNMKKLTGKNPEDQAKCIANSLLTRLNQKISLVITTTTMQPPLAADLDSTFFQNQGSQPQVMNANSGTYSYPLYQNPKIRPQVINTNGAKINHPNTDQNIPPNNVENRFLQGNNFPINDAVPNNNPQNQLNLAPGPRNQKQDSSAIVINKNIRANPNLQNMDRINNDDGINNAAIIFYQQLSNNLLTSPYISSIYNEETTKMNAKTITATLLLGTLSADYDKLAIEITRECIGRMGSVQTGSNTETYTTLIATCITDVFSYYGLILKETASAQASDISSKIIAWLKGDNNGNNNQLANRNIDVQSNLPNQGAINYPDSYSGIPNLSQSQQLASSGVLASNSEGNADYNPNTDSLAPQYLPIDYQNLNSHSPPITYNNFQNIRTSSNADISSAKTNIDKCKKKNANKKKNKKPKKNPVVSKTNSNFNNNYPVNSAAKSKPTSPPDINNGNYFMDYNGNQNYQPNYVPNTQLPGFQNYPLQNVNQGYDLTAGGVEINDNISDPQQSYLVVENSPRRKKCKKIKNGTGNNATNKGSISDDSDTSYNPINQKGPPALDMTNNPQTFQSNGYAGFLNSNYNAISNQNTPAVSLQSQIIPDERNDEVKNRIRYLTKGVLSSMSNGKFDYKYFSDIIAKVSENLQTTHPELGSQTSLIKTLIDSITACTQLLIKVPANYFDDNGVLQNSDIPDAAAIDYSNSILPIQVRQSTTPSNQNNMVLNDQSYGSSTLQQPNNVNYDQTGQRNFYPGGSDPIQNKNLLPKQAFGIQSFPRDVGGNAFTNAQTSGGVSSQTAQDNSLPRLPNGYGVQNLQNNLALQPSGGLNNPNLQPGNMENQNIQSGNPYLTGLP